MSGPARVQMAHGGGGRAMHALIRDVFAAAYGNDYLAAAHDGAVLPRPPGPVAITTDAFVVRPLFFPGGDIGRLAVFGTVNDLAMCGARPLALTAAFVLEEGVPIDTVARVARSVAAAAREAGVTIAAGDTKVVERGKADGLYVATAGIGAAPEGAPIGPARVRAGDVLLLSGDVGRHGIAVLAARAELALEVSVESDCAPLNGAVQALLASGAEVHCLRDLTRGGLTSALVEVAESAGLDARVEERAIPVSDPVRSACEILGFDPLPVACEGRFAAWVAAADADRALAALRATGVARGAVRIGAMTGPGRGTVTLDVPLGAARVMDMLSGEQLPRIC